MQLRSWARQRTVCEAAGVQEAAKVVADVFVAVQEQRAAHVSRQRHDAVVVRICDQRLRGRGEAVENADRACRGEVGRGPVVVPPLALCGASVIDVVCTTCRCQDYSARLCLAAPAARHRHCSAAFRALIAECYTKSYIVHAASLDAAQQLSSFSHSQAAQHRGARAGTHRTSSSPQYPPL